MPREEKSKLPKGKGTQTSNEKELNERRAKWGGFTYHFGEEKWRYARYKETNAWWESPTGRRFHDLPDFPKDETACHRDLLPSLGEYHLHFFWGLNGLICSWTIEECSEDIKRNTYYSYGKTSADAFCKVLDRLITDKEEHNGK